MMSFFIKKKNLLQTKFNENFKFGWRKFET